MKNQRSNLGKARGLGAGGGAHEWWAHRTSGLFLIPLFLWFMWHVPALADMTHGELVGWLQKKPSHAIGMVLLVAVGFFNASHGAQVVLEDYVHTQGRKILSILLLKFVLLFSGAVAIYSILKIGFGA